MKKEDTDATEEQKPGIIVQTLKLEDMHVGGPLFHGGTVSEWQEYLARFEAIGLGHVPVVDVVGEFVEPVVLHYPDDFIVVDPLHFSAAPVDDLMLVLYTTHDYEESEGGGTEDGEADQETIAGS